MKKISVQSIEDSYINRGYRGTRLRKALAKDVEYQKILKVKKRKVTSNIKVTATEKKRFVLATNLDFEILDSCKQLEKKRLSKDDRKMVRLIKSQLIDDWRAPLVAALKTLLREYRA